MTTRRNFLKKSALATAGTLFIPQFLQAFEQLKHFSLENTDKNLVIIQLSGGNDGLNTIVPFRNDIYYQKRSTIAIAKEKVLKVSDELGFTPSLAPLQSLFDEGQMCIINSVGYPNPDRSHFRSMDIWHTGSASNQHWQTGWIGRFLDAQCQNCDHAHTAIEVDDTLSLAMKGKNIKGLAVRDPKKLYEATQAPFLKQLVAQEHHHEHEMANYLYKTLRETVSSSKYIYEKSSVKKTSTSYPMTEFGKQLKTVAQMIQAGLDTRVYYISLGSFDTHVRQSGQQERLLKQYAEGLKALVDDLKKQGKLEKTLIMTFSEFGRRVAQNASGGTDHGTANNLFLVGRNLKKQGFYNASPNLSALDKNGDLKFEIDFRQVYATILDKWLNSSSETILQEKFTTLAFL